jgi:hypothetical protein
LAITLIGSAAWLLTVSAVMAAILTYSNTPGPTGKVPLQWPPQSQISPDVLRPTLVLFAHPHCPCTRASIGELEQLMARCQGKVSAQVWFLQPAGLPEDWSQTDLWRTASKIPGVTVHADVGGREAECFQAQTSGQTLLYDRNGRLMFHGGITLSRGHAGDNPGRSALEDLLEHATAGTTQTPVFGCSLIEAACRPGTANCKP